VNVIRKAVEKDDGMAILRPRFVIADIEQLGANLADRALS
jgi:hypothetical protein